MRTVIREVPFAPAEGEGRSQEEEHRPPLDEGPDEKADATGAVSGKVTALNRG